MGAMVFCGRCGLQLAPGSTRCPRCGALTEVDVVAENPHMDDPTFVSPRLDEIQTQRGQVDQRYPPGMALTPLHNALRQDEQPSNPGSSYNPYTPMPPVEPVSHPGYEQPTSPDYPSSPMAGQYGDWNTPIPHEPAPRRGGLFFFIAVIIVVLIAGGIAFALFNPQLQQILNGGQPTPTITQTPGPSSTPSATATPTAVQEARAVIDNYYNDINSRDYQDAYNLWSNAYQNSQTESAFAAGYTNTIHDSITILSLTEQAGGTVQASLTITANEQSSSGPVVSTYQGTYVIGVENGTWKFLSGHFSKVS